MTTPRPVAEAENRLERFNAERIGIVEQVTDRVVGARVEAARGGEEQSLEYVLNEVAFSEIKRYEGSRSKDAARKLSRWRELAGKLGRLSPEDARRELETLVRQFAQDVAGNFNPRVYRFANGILPPALSFFLSPISSVRDGMTALGSLESQVYVEGAVDAVRAAADRGTLVFAPTHSSNLDSIAVGFGLMRAQLPPVTYGAGKNLFSNPFISFFMRNLGAYRVDRRLKFGLYKDVLKEYSTVLLERGYHSLFFPGGTRSRSNQVEQKLKLGLLGTAVTAYHNCLRDATSARRLYIVPMTINYRLVLEAETLIDDYLEDTGKSRYIIEDDEFSRLGRIIEFSRKLFAHDGAVILRMGMPLDPFGNATDESGESLDHRGRRIDPADFLRGADGSIEDDPQRDAEYTRALGTELAHAFLRETVFTSTPLICRAMLDAVRARTGVRDIYRLLRLPPSAVAIDRSDVEARADRLRARIAAAPEWGRVDRLPSAMDPAELVDDAMRLLTTYHTRPVLEPSGNRLRVGSMKLLYYYANRTDHVPGEGAA
jgi:glycerol-3-phosphate O-acyltransferase